MVDTIRYRIGDIRFRALFAKIYLCKVHFSNDDNK